MKRTNLLALSLIAFFALVAVSCTTTQGMYDEDQQYQNARQVGNRIYVDDPYHGTIVLERDPYTGRYYDVTYGSRSLRSPYNSLGDYRYDSRYYNSRPYYRPYNRGGSVQTPQPQPRSEDQKKTMGAGKRRSA